MYAGYDIKCILYAQYYHRRKDKRGCYWCKNVFDKEVYPINIRFEGKENKYIKELGSYKTISIVPDLIEGNVFKKEII